MYRRRWPVCCDPFQRGCQAVTKQISHIKAAGSHPELAFREDNLAPTCSRCESLISAIERRGDDPSHHFAGWRDRYPISANVAQAPGAGSNL
jgi:hypothetical protein